MATEIVSQTATRKRLALEAVAELEAVSGCMVDLSQDMGGADLVFRSLSIRALQLAQIVTSALDDDVDTVQEIEERLMHGGSTRVDPAQDRLARGG